MRQLEMLANSAVSCTRVQKSFTSLHLPTRRYLYPCFLGPDRFIRSQAEELMGLCPQDALHRTWPSQRPGDEEEEVEEQQSARYVPLPVCLGQVCPALQGLTDPHICL